MASSETNHSFESDLFSETFDPVHKINLYDLFTNQTYLVLKELVHSRIKIS